MQEQKDIFDLFRANEHKIYEKQPSRQAWRRLERRLDAHDKRNRLTFFRTLSMVAGILLLVVLIGVISMTQVPKETVEVISANSIDLADQEIASGRIAALRVKYQEQERSPIREGSAATKIIPAVFEGGD